MAPFGQFAWNREVGRWHDRLNDPECRESIEELRADVAVHWTDERVSEMILQTAGGCRCLDLEEFAKVTYEYLSTLTTQEGKSGGWDWLGEHVGEIGRVLMLGRLEEIGLIEHGGNAIYSWPTDAGDAWRDLYRMDTEEGLYG